MSREPCQSGAVTKNIIATQKLESQAWEGRGRVEGGSREGWEVQVEVVVVSLLLLFIVLVVAVVAVVGGSLLVVI